MQMSSRHLAFALLLLSWMPSPALADLAIEAGADFGFMSRNPKMQSFSSLAVSVNPTQGRSNADFPDHLLAGKLAVLDLPFEDRSFTSAWGFSVQYLFPLKTSTTGVSLDGKSRYSMDTSLKGLSAGPLFRLYLVPLASIHPFIEAGLNFGKLSLDQNLSGSSNGQLSASAWFFNPQARLGTEIRLSSWLSAIVSGGVSRYQSNAFSADSRTGDYASLKDGGRLYVDDQVLNFRQTVWTAGASLMVLF